ncbi:MAG: NAD(P)-dependent oxidoreductase [Plectolyngbya sp. WJT66-NPBG17]|jgi:nucleoside-diphosphate-sugar epimerase|nr:NAD(P)-dependent oxidoreductase [Plectolyngbya sp. WJT66-NPBG17]MBW4526874.1 NAD(P)-dependent oxidoreductase [Phormidium tanganyikae FI6-MK23]
MTKRIFVTGASGCIGHYLVEALIQETQYELFLLVRDANKLKIDVTVRSNITVIQSDMCDIEQHRELLKTIDCVVLAATAWGGESVQAVNISKNLALLSMLDTDRIEQVIYFSTASILDRQNQLLPEAMAIGNDYLKSKYVCYEKLAGLAIAPKITKLFPTLVIGGGERYPYSHLTAGVPEVAKWAKLIRFFRADGSFHFIHGHDIAQVVRQFIDHPPAEKSIVLGNEKITVNQAIDEMCEYLGSKPILGIPLLWLADVIIFLFRIQVGEWDRFALRYRHFTHQNPVSPATFGMENYCSTMEDVLKLSGVRKKTSSSI